MGEIVGAIIGGSAQKKAAKSAADAQVKAAQLAAEQFKPFNVTTDLGAAKVKGNAITAMLSPEARALLDQQYADASGPLDQATQRTLGIMNQLAAPGEELARRTNQEQLFAAGRTGTAGGIRQMGEVEQALAMARLQRELYSREMAYNERQGAFTNYLALAQAPAANLIPGSVNRNPAAAVAGAGYMNAASIQGAQSMGFANSLTKSLNDSGVYNSLGNSIASIFNSQSMSGSAFNNMRYSGNDMYTPTSGWLD